MQQINHGWIQTEIYSNVFANVIISTFIAILLNVMACAHTYYGYNENTISVDSITGNKLQWHFG